MTTVAVVSAPAWALAELNQLLYRLSKPGTYHFTEAEAERIDDAWKALTPIEPGEPAVPAETFAAMVTAYAQARSTRDAAQAEASAQTLRAREATAARDALLEQFGRLLAVADTAWGYLESTLRPCAEDCECILHDFEALKAAGIPLKTKGEPRLRPCICPVVGGPFGPMRHQWNPACRRHPAKPAEFERAEPQWDAPPDEVAEQAAAEQAIAQIGQQKEG